MQHPSRELMQENLDTDALVDPSAPRVPKYIGEELVEGMKYGAINLAMQFLDTVSPTARQTLDTSTPKAIENAKAVSTLELAGHLYATPQQGADAGEVGTYLIDSQIENVLQAANDDLNSTMIKLVNPAQSALSVPKSIGE